MLNQIAVRDLRATLKLFGAISIVLSLTACVTTPEAREEQDAIYEPANAHIELALSYVASREFPAALEQLEKSTNLAAVNPELDHAYGIYYQKTGDIDKAEVSFRAAVRKDPTNPQYNNNYGVLLSQTGQYKEALKRFSVAYSNEEYSNRASAYENYADIKVQQGDHALALENYEKALSLNPRWFLLEVKMANSLYNRGDFASAYTRFDNYMNRVNELNIRPSNQDIELGLAIAAAVKDYDKVDEYQKILEQGN
ncbi:MAG: tetratricopeptide repeat protein [Gammaproteobacteria bacterium]|nr:tetratricopeptide repeat protein [Gammaproteobacteria bacterium]